MHAWFDCLSSYQTYIYIYVYYETTVPTKDMFYYIIIVKHDTIKHACLIRLNVEYSDILHHLLQSSGIL